jgi:hypothetical protein
MQSPGAGRYSRVRVGRARGRDRPSQQWRVTSRIAVHLSESLPRRRRAPLAEAAVGLAEASK